MLRNTPALRSLTGHAILPARQSAPTTDPFYAVKRSSALLSYTFGRGTVIWRIYPAVLVHTAFAALIVSLYEESKIRLAVPAVLLTVLGVVIGFVISYRAMSGYDRYWMGRSTWSDVIHHSRSLSRIFWFHVQPRIKGIANGSGIDVPPPSEDEVAIVMAEKRMALDLIEGYVVALKHHLRDENGIYYEDLYDLVRPLHDHRPHPTVISPVGLNPASNQMHPSYNGITENAREANHPSRPRSTSPLLQPPMASNASTHNAHVDRKLVPFDSFFTRFIHFLGFTDSYQKLSDVEEGHQQPNGPIGPTAPTDPFSPISPDSHSRDGKPVVHLHKGSEYKKKRRISIAGGGSNLPLDIVRCLSEWLGILEMRNTISGNAGGQAFATLGALEDCVGVLEKILTTPLPFTYSAHIRHTVWIYLFFLPSQLVENFHWFTIPGVTIASFIYLGFLAAGEEIEQPFGYDENDLDLDLFARQLVHADINSLKSTHCAFSPLGSSSHIITKPHRSLVEVSAYNKGKGPEGLSTGPPNGIKRSESAVSVRPAVDESEDMPANGDAKLGKKEKRIAFEETREAEQRVVFGVIKA